MGTIRIGLEDDIKMRWRRLAEMHDLVPEEEMRAAIINRLEELEDHFVVRSRLTQPYDAVSDEEVWRRIGASRAPGTERT
jgi:hypothetical protein